MSRLVKALVPKPLLRRIKGILEYRADRKWYSRFSGPDDDDATSSMDQIHLEMQITKDYHRVEKGLALPIPRRPFGDAAAKRLHTFTPVAKSKAADAPFVHYATTATEALAMWNSTGEISDTTTPPGPTATERGILDPTLFFTSRHSVRNFADTAVPRELLDKAVSLAINTPSVCNRQSWHVWLFDQREDIDRALRFQNGNAGFGHTVPALALITTDTGLFAGINERNQVWIEGGLFSMSLAWALHALGLSTCMLNMSQRHARLQALKRELGIPEREAVVMFMAIGYPADGYRVARSPRRTLGQVVRYLSPPRTA